MYNRTLEKDWGKPKREQTSHGYRVIYTNPADSKNKLIINIQNRMWASHQFPPHVKGHQIVDGQTKETSTPQEFRVATVMGKRTKFYQMTEGVGTKANSYRAMGMRFTNPEGKVGYYLIDYEGEEKDFPLRLQEIGW